MFFLKQTKVIQLIQFQRFTLETCQIGEHELLFAVETCHVVMTQNIRGVTMKAL
ncbi:Uncharacterised protein [Vibrio cholerae]|nr:Uncharacterised protein [Vibrio cholerae]